MDDSFAISKDDAIEIPRSVRNLRRLIETRLPRIGLEDLLEAITSFRGRSLASCTIVARQEASDHHLRFAQVQRRARSWRCGSPRSLPREGLRLSEALALRWRDLDLVRGVVTLDRNKTASPRSWALADGVAEALAAFKGEAGPDALVMPQIDATKAAKRFRVHLEAAGVNRAELHQRSEVRRPIRLHDLRATFITIALAEGRSEAWVQDRTGHTTSQMLNKYRRQARFASELGLGGTRSTRGCPGGES